MSKKQLTDFEKIELVDLYLKGSGIKELANKFDRAESSVRDLIKRRNIKLRTLSEVNRKYEINENFFDVINTEEKAYFLGFLYADGNVKRNKNFVVLSVKESDREILEKLNILIYKNKPLFLYKEKRNNRENIVGIRICNKKITNKLIEFGCVPAKTFILTFPKWLNKNLYSSFIRGYFDGDGYIGELPDSRNKNNSFFKFSLTGTVEFLEEVAKIFKNMLDVNCSFDIRHKESNNNITTLNVKGGSQIEKLFDFLYKDSYLFMKRKKEIFLKIKNRKTK